MNSLQAQGIYSGMTISLNMLLKGGALEDLIPKQAMCPRAIETKSMILINDEWKYNIENNSTIEEIGKESTYGWMRTWGRDG